MRKEKPARWYEIEGDKLYVYDAPYRDCSFSVVITSTKDLPYYRSNFHLTKLWGVRFA